MDDPKDGENSEFWRGFAAGFMYFLFLLLLEIFTRPYLSDAEIWGLPIAVTVLLAWIGSTKEDMELKIFKAGTFILAAILTPFIYELLAPLGKINPVLQILPALLIAFGISIGIGFAILAAVKKH